MSLDPAHGHMLNHTVHDVVVRRKRMQGFNTLWLPGMIMPASQPRTSWSASSARRPDTARSRPRKFIERVWQWKQQYGGIILKQIRRIVHRAIVA